MDDQQMGVMQMKLIIGAGFYTMQYIQCQCGTISARNETRTLPVRTAGSCRGGADAYL
ncbi:hypothetical protein KVMX100_120319 [Klebsiella variicola]|nr:hypothetical protein KVMX100_120319 [Klebsiella variicola]